jgi:hypothetical protein
MIGYVAWTKGGRVTVREQSIGRLRFLSASIPQRGPAVLRRYFLRIAARRMSRLGIARAVFPPSFDALETFACWGIRPVDTLPLYRALAAQLVWAELAQKNLRESEALVAIYSDHLTAEVQRTVTALCIRCRYVLLCIADGDGERFCRRLRRELGVPLVLTAETARLAQADALVQFASMEEPPTDGQAVLSLYRGAERTLPALRAEGVSPPTDCDSAMLYAALWETGILRTEQLRLAEEPAAGA